MHNESLADQVVENASTNGGGVFEPGETGIAFNKDETGVKFGLRLSNRQLIIGAAVLIGTSVLGKTLNRAALTQKAAKATHEVADKVEEVAA